MRLAKYAFLGLWLSAASGSIGVARDFSIYAVNGPLGYFAARLVGDHGQVTMPVPPETDPAFWQPTIEDIAAFQSADLILLNGADYAKWVENAALPRSRLIDTSKAYSNSLITEQGTVSHSHGGGEAHSHAGLAFTTWLDFDLAAQQADAIAAALTKKLPDSAAEIKSNLTGLRDDLTELAAEQSVLGERLAGEAIIVSHPIYQYLSRASGLDLPSLTWEPDVVPDDDQLADLDRLIADSGARFMIWENRPIDAAANLVAERGLTNLVFRTGNNIAPDEDFIALMRMGLSEIAEIANR